MKKVGADFISPQLCCLLITPPCQLPFISLLYLTLLLVQSFTEPEIPPLFPLSTPPFKYFDSQFPAMGAFLALSGDPVPTPPEWRIPVAPLTPCNMLTVYPSLPAFLLPHQAICQRSPERIL